MKIIIECVIIAALIGCNNASNPASIDANQMLDAGAIADDAASAVEYECTAPCVIRWRELAAIDQAVDHHSIFIIERTDGPYLYVLGGIEPTPPGTGIASYSPRLLAARILEDGTLGPWEANDFGYGIAFHAQTQYVDSDGNDRVMWAGGLMMDPAETPIMPAGSSYTWIAVFEQGAGSNVENIRIANDGAVGALAGRLAEPVLHGTAAMREEAGSRNLFLIGGSRGNTLTTDALRYDNTTSAWVMDTPLPSPRSHHALVQINGRLVLLGGFAGPTGSSSATEPSILASIHDDTGHITGWEDIGTMEDAPVTASAFARDGFSASAL